MFVIGNQREYLILYLKSLYTAFLHSVKPSKYRIGIKIDEDLLAVEKKCLTKTVNTSIVSDLHAWPGNPTKNSKFKNWLFVATNVVKINDKEM